MKVLFVCRTARTKMMVHIASILQDKGFLEQAYAFVAYYDQWRDYLQKQKKVSFTGIYGTKDIFRKMKDEQLDISELGRIEEEYGSSEIWNIVLTEPYLSTHTHPVKYNHPKYSHRDILRYVQINFQYFEKILKNIDAIIDFAHVCIFRGVLDLVAKRYDIPFLHPINSLIKNKWHIAVRVNEEHMQIKKLYHELLTSDDSCRKGHEHLRWFREERPACVYGGFQSSTGPLAKKGKVKIKWINHLIKLLNNIAKAILFEAYLRCRALFNPEIRYNFNLYKGCFSIKQYRAVLSGCRRFWIRLKKPFYNGSVDGKYAFMTLHWQPEASTTVLAPYFNNQLAVIENISRALPLDWKLVIKPQGGMADGRDPISFYTKILQIPNTLLISPTAPTRQYIENASAVVTITGTSGFEAALLGKPVILLGNQGVVWHMLKDVIKCTDFTKLHHIFKNIESHTVDDRSLVAYLEALDRSSFDLEGNCVWEGPYDIKDRLYCSEITEMTKAIIERYHRYKKAMEE